MMDEGIGREVEMGKVEGRKGRGGKRRVGREGKSG